MLFTFSKLTRKTILFLFFFLCICFFIEEFSRPATPSCSFLVGYRCSSTGGVEQTVILWDPLALPFYPPPRPIFSSSLPSSPSIPGASTSLSAPSSSSAVSSVALSPSPSSQVAASVSHESSPLYIHPPKGDQHTPMESLRIATAEKEGQGKSSLFHPSMSSSRGTSTTMPRDNELANAQEISESPRQHRDDGCLLESLPKSPCEADKKQPENGTDLGVNVREKTDYRKQVNTGKREEETKRRRLWGNEEGGLLPPWLDFPSFSEAQLLQVLCSLLHARKQRSLKKWVKEGDEDEEDAVMASSSASQGGSSRSCRREAAKRYQPFNRSGEGEDEQGRGAAQDKRSQEERKRGTREEEEDKEGDEREREREDRKSDGGVAKGGNGGSEQEDDRYMKEDEKRRGIQSVLLYYLSGEFSSPVSFDQSLPTTASTPSALHHAPEKRTSGDISPHGKEDSPSFSCDGYLSLIGHLYRYLVSEDKRPSSPWLRLLHLWLSSSSSSSQSQKNGDATRPPPSGDGLYSSLLLNGRLPWMSTSSDPPWVKNDQDIAVSDRSLSSSQPPAKPSLLPQEGSHVSSASDSSPCLSFSTPRLHSLLDRDSPSPLFWLALAGSAGACDGRSPQAARTWRAAVCSFVNHRLREIERERKQQEARYVCLSICECCIHALLCMSKQ